MSALSALDAPRALAVIPARGGSKGLPGKNLKKIGGETLVARAVGVALESGVFSRIVVSTDDMAIAAEGRKAGADVPFLRPAALSSDTANVLDAVQHLLPALSADGEFDLVVLLEPTSPARTPAIVRETVLAACAEGADAAFTVSEVPLRYHARKQFERDQNQFAVHAQPSGKAVVSRQQLAPTFIRNGMCYAVRRSALAAGHGILGSHARLVIVTGPVINIDGAEDFALARQVLEA